MSAGTVDMELNVMPIDKIIERVTDICKRQGVRKLVLFGSFATGTPHPRSDVDFVVYGCKDFIALEEEVDEIDTLRKIDLFDYESIHNPFLLEDIEKYGKPIYESLPDILQEHETP